MLHRRRDWFFVGGVVLVCAAVAFALRKEVEAVWLVHRLNTSKDWHARANAAIALGRLKVRRSAPDLVKRLKDPAQEVRWNCTWALAEVTGQPWGIQDGPAPEWWEKNGKEFLAGKAVPSVPRVALPQASGGGRYLDAVVTLAEERVYHLGQDGDVIRLNVAVRNKTDQPLTVLHPPWEEYEAYEYHPDGTRTPVDVRPAAPSSAVLTAARSSRSRVGVREETVEQFHVLDDTIPAGGITLAPFEVTVTRQRPGIWFETYRLEATLYDVALETPEGMVTERVSAPAVTVFAWISGKDVFEQLGEEAQEVAKSGREVIGLAWARVFTGGGDRAAGHGTPLLFPPGARAYARKSWVRLTEGEANPSAPELFIGGADARSEGSEGWVIVTRE